MNKPPFSYEEAVKAATISSQIEGYNPTTDKEILKQADKIVKKILKTSALEGQLPDDETVKIITDKVIYAINAKT
ncbi:MAG: hypothetical protein Q9M43_04560 [Sulfurimonas sp.]|nr:hypothetical protein [Sulfurimonas sp.]